MSREALLAEEVEEQRLAEEAEAQRLQREREEALRNPDPEEVARAALYDQAVDEFNALYPPGSPMRASQASDPLASPNTGTGVTVPGQDTDADPAVTATPRRGISFADLQVNARTILNTVSAAATNLTTPGRRGALPTADSTGNQGPTVPAASTPASSLIPAPAPARGGAGRGGPGRGTAGRGTRPGRGTPPAGTGPAGSAAPPIDVAVQTAAAATAAANAAAAAQAAANATALADASTAAQAAATARSAQGTASANAATNAATAAALAATTATNNLAAATQRADAAAAAATAAIAALTAAMAGVGMGGAGPGPAPGPAPPGPPAPGGGGGGGPGGGGGGGGGGAPGGVLPPLPPPTDFELMLMRFGMSRVAARNIVTRAAPDLTQLGELTTQDIGDHIKAMRRPGGQILVGGTYINDPGIDVSSVSASYLKACAWAVKSLQYASRTCVPGDFDLDTIAEWKTLWLQDLAYEETTDVPDATLFFNDWPKGFDTLDEFIKQRRTDLSFISLAYLTRKIVTVVPEALDPRTNYSCLEDEQIARNSHTRFHAGLVVPALSYVKDNKKLYSLLTEIFRDTSAYVFMKGFVKKQDGRGAYMALWDHYLGPNNTADIASKNDRDIRALTYTGEGRRFTFEKYVEGHTKCHNIYDGLVEFGHCGMDEGTKVRTFLDGIKCNALRETITSISRDRTCQTSFVETVAQFKSSIQSLGIERKTVQNARISKTTVAAANVKPGNNTNNNGKSISWKDQADGEVKVANRFYDNTEYRRLSSAQKDKLRKMRLAAGQGGGDTKKQKPNNENHNPNASAAATSTQKSSLKKKSKKNGNRSHPALRRDKRNDGDDSD
jgi:hypothetical protein